MNIFAFWKENSGGNEEDRLERKNAKDQQRTPEMNMNQASGEDGRIFRMFKK